MERTLQRAQIAVLEQEAETGPSRDMCVQSISSGGLIGEKKTTIRQRSLAFSRNVICVDVSSPDLVNLSFVDLPGKICGFYE